DSGLDQPVIDEARGLAGRAVEVAGPGATSREEGAREADALELPAQALVQLGEAIPGNHVTEDQESVLGEVLLARIGRRWAGTGRGLRHRVHGLPGLAGRGPAPNMTSVISPAPARTSM